MTIMLVERHLNHFFYRQGIVLIFLEYEFSKFVKRCYADPLDRKRTLTPYY